eukprot:6465185-Amphidinium_carterae.1
MGHARAQQFFMHGHTHEESATSAPGILMIRLFKTQIHPSKQQMMADPTQQLSGSHCDIRAVAILCIPIASDLF